MPIAVRTRVCQLGAAAALTVALACGDDPTPDVGPGEIVFASDRQFGTFDIYIMNANGTGLRRVTDTLAFDSWPAWSPDGRSIAFHSDRVVRITPPDTIIVGNDTTFVPEDTVANLDVYVMNADGTAQTRLTTDTMADGQPAWSPDGTKIAFASTSDGDAEIYVMNADGTGLVQLTSNAASDEQPAWSPDGFQIAFTSDRGGNGDIFVMSALDGSGAVNRTNRGGDDLAPFWSPDGTRIAFQSDRDGDFAIYVMNADGTGVVRLTDGRVPDGTPSWSPDGTRLAFDSNGDIHVMRADGSRLVRVTRDFATDFLARWRP